MAFQAKRIRSRRLAYNLSQEELASLVGTSQRQISKYELGVNEPTAEVIIRLSLALNTTADWLLGLTDNPDRPLRDESELDDIEQEVVKLLRAQDLHTRKWLADTIRTLLLKPAS